MLRFKGKLRLVRLAAALLVSALMPLTVVQAQAAAHVVAINIPAQPAESALKAFVAQTKFQLIYAPYVVNGITTRAVIGRLSPPEALGKLLKGTGIVIVSTGENAATLQRKPDAAAVDATAHDAAGSRPAR